MLTLNTCAVKRRSTLNPIALNEAVSAYHLGEKPIADVSNALFIYRVGEKTLYTVSDLGAALRTIPSRRKGCVRETLSIWVQQ